MPDPTPAQDFSNLIPPDPIGLPFTGADHQALSKALVKAFPSYQKLEMLVQFRLGVNLQEISSAFNELGYVAFQLVNNEKAAGHLLRLVAAARASQSDNPELALVAERLRLATPSPPRAQLEKIVKKTSVPFDVTVWRQRLAKREVCVCRIEVPTNKGPAMGTGFLVGADLVMTNHHVIAAAIAGQDGKYTADGATAKAEAIVVRFDYKALDDGTRINPGVEVRLADDWLVDASAHSEVDFQGLPKQGVPDPELLDFALLRLAEPVGEQPIPLGSGVDPEAKNRGWIELLKDEWPFEQQSALFIIQHPLGTPMKLALDYEAQMKFNDNHTRVIYQTGTDSGSSGSPCFNQSWNLVALHHVGDPSAEGFYNPAFNEGIPISRIVERLTAKDLLPGLTIV
jgi:Trypsin-like peptidase domain/Effector-associated domain 1